ASRHVEAFGAQHGGKGDEGQSDERRGIVAAKPREQADAEAFTLRRARAVERRLALEISLDLRVGQAAERDVGRDEPLVAPLEARIPEAKRRVEEHSVPREGAQL